MTIHYDLKDKFLMLSPRECDFIRLFYGLYDGRLRSYEEIGQLFGIKKSEVKKIEETILQIMPEIFCYHRLLWAIFCEFIPIQNIDFLKLKKTTDDILQCELNTREQEVLTLRFGLRDGQHRSYKSTGEIIPSSKSEALSGERIRQIESKAIRKLRHPRIRKIFNECISEDIQFINFNFKTFNEMLNLIDKSKNIAEIQTEEINKEYEQIAQTERETIIKSRIGQDKLRKELLEHKCRCEICGLELQDALVASHIKSWKDSNDNEKVDIENVLLLCAIHDKLFDKGYISFDNKGKIIISNQLNENTQALLNIHDESRIENISDRKASYLEYHRTHSNKLK